MTSQIIPLPLLALESGKCGKEGKNYKNLNILRMERAF